MHRAASHAAGHGESVCTPGVYRRRRPERTLAWQTAQAWLATWIAHHDEADAELVPAHVQRELSAYLECGILAHGFARARCPAHGAMQQRDDLDTRRSRHLDPPVDVMPDNKNQNQDLVW